MGRVGGGAIGLAVTLAFLAWVLHDVRPADLLLHLRRADPLSLIAAVILATLTFPLRTLRWQLILRDVDGRRFPWRPLWRATAVGFMANNLLPARAGEVARAYVAGRQVSVRFTTALASVAVERVFDALVLMGLMALAIAAPSFPRAATVDGSRVTALASGVALVFGALLLVALLVVHRPAPWLAVFGRIARRLLPARLADRVTHAIEGLVAGLTVLRSPARFAGVVGWSLVLWLVSAASYALCFRAFHIDLPLESALLLQGVIALGVALPSSPGFFGPFEAATRVTLALYGVGADVAVSYAVGYHLSTFVPITLLGLHALTRLHVRLADLRQAGTAPEGKPE
ncbi:MAG: lysylphosphatidylglycerol synthase transmembrane domain-containing protein [Gemmatimonadales bacterium]